MRQRAYSSCLVMTICADLRCGFAPAGFSCRCEIELKSVDGRALPDLLWEGEVVRVLGVSAAYEREEKICFKDLRVVTSGVAQVLELFWDNIDRGPRDPDRWSELCIRPGVVRLW